MSTVLPQKKDKSRKKSPFLLVLTGGFALSAAKNVAAHSSASIVRRANLHSRTACQRISVWRRRFRNFRKSGDSLFTPSLTSFAQTAVVLLTTLSKCSTIMRQTKLGVMAQLVARLNGIQKVRGSNPLSSTRYGGLLVVATKKERQKRLSFFVAPYCCAA